jgi:hypothetical protein
MTAIAGARAMSVKIKRGRSTRSTRRRRNINGVRQAPRDQDLARDRAHRSDTVLRTTSAAPTPIDTVSLRPRHRRAESAVLTHGVSKHRRLHEMCSAT